MKKPWYEPSAGALLAFLNASTQCIPDDLFTITLQNGTVLRYCSLDAGVTISGTTWLPGPYIRRTAISRKVGLEVATMQMQIAADDTVTVGGVPIIHALRAGLFSGALVMLDRVYRDSDGVVQGAYHAFFGRVGEVQTSIGRGQIEVRSHSELLDVMVPGEVYQPGCRDTLFDLRCGLSKSAFKTSSVVSVGSTAARNSFGCSVTGKAAGYFDLGTVTFKTGLNSGLSRTIRKVTSAGGIDTFALVAPMPYAIAAGDTFDAYPGCDKRKVTCQSKFNNVSRFRAEPYIPAPETVT